MIQYLFFFKLLIHVSSANCAAATITQVSVSNVDYPVSSFYSDVLPEFVLSIPGCSVTYSLTQSDGSSVPAAITFTPSTREFIIWHALNDPPLSLHY